MDTLTVPDTDLATQINAEHAQVERVLRTGLEHARRAGELLLMAKAQREHGEWLPWVRDNLDFSVRTAQGYMRVAEHWPELMAKAQGLAHLGFEDGLKLLANQHSPLDDWRNKWRQAGVWFPAATGAELRDWWIEEEMPAFSGMPAFDKDDEWWHGLLLKILRKSAAQYLIRTGELLLPPPNSRNQDFLSQHNEISAWQIYVEREAGGFLNWCEKVGINWKSKRLRLPDEPRLDALKDALCAEFEGEEYKSMGNRELAELFEIPEDELPALLVNWMRGKFYLFLGIGA
jgi:hypothetical protein